MEDRRFAREAFQITYSSHLPVAAAGLVERLLLLEARLKDLEDRLPEKNESARETAAFASGMPARTYETR